MADGKSTKLDEHQRLRRRPPKSKKKVSFPSCCRSGLQRLRMFALFWIFSRAFGAGWTFWEPFVLLLAVSMAQGRRVHSVHLVHRKLEVYSVSHRKLERSILPSKLAKTEIWIRNYWEPISQFVVEWRIVPGGLCIWRWHLFALDREKCLWGCITKNVHFWKKQFLTNSGRKKSAPSQRDPPAKIALAKFLRQMTAKDFT